MGYIQHGTMQDVIDYVELIKFQAKSCSEPKKIISARKPNYKIANKNNKKILRRKFI